MSDFVLFGDCLPNLRTLATLGFKFRMCVTSPPYFGLRSYLPEGHPDKIFEMGSEETPEIFIDRLVEVFRAVRDVLTDDGTLWVNIGDSYAGVGGHGRQGGQQFAERMRGKTLITRAARYTGGDCKTKDLIGIPWMLAFALRADGWYLRQDIIWHKPNPMPESVNDRCTKAHEYIFLLSKSPKYFYDVEAVKESASGTAHARGSGVGPKAALNVPGNKMNSSFSSATRGILETRNLRSVWTTATRPYAGAHFATFPPALILPCVLAGSAVGDTILDPFMGSGTTAQVAKQNGRFYVGCELNAENAPLIEKRVSEVKA